MDNKNLKWTGKSAGGRFGNAWFAMLLRIGVFPAYVLLIFVAAFFMVFRQRQCAESSSYLSRIFKRKINGISWNVYKHLFSFGMSILDRYAYFSGANIECVDECKNKILSARNRGKGVVLVVSHIGGWSISGGKLAEYECPTGVIGVSQEHEYIENMAEARRTRKLPNMIATSDDSMAMITAASMLRRNGIVAIHGDRYVAGKFVKTHLLGSEVRIPISAYALAAKTGASIVNVFCVREKIGKYKMFCSDIRVLENLRGTEMLQQYQTCADLYMQDIEKLLTNYPYQWYNFYPFWMQ